MISVNKLASRSLPGGSEERVMTVRARPESGIREQVKSEVSANAPARGRGQKDRTYVYAPDSLWSNLRYGLGTLAVILLPPLIPGVTGRELIMGYMGALVTVFSVVCVWGMVRSLYPSERRR